MSNPASRAQAIFNYIATRDGVTYDDIRSYFEGVMSPTQVFDTMAKLHRDDVVASGEERPRLYRAVKPIARRHPLYQNRTGDG